MMGGRISELTLRARDLRRNQTDAEKIMWAILRSGHIQGYRFHRQFVIEHYIADFVCRDLDLIIEIDGGQHNGDRDKTRTEFLEHQGYKIIRFWNNDVLQNLSGVYEVIENEIILRARDLGRE